jgi:hypothetical protein
MKAGEKLKPVNRGGVESTGEETTVKLLEMP